MKPRVNIISLSVIAVVAGVGIVLPLGGNTTQAITINHEVVVASSTAGEGVGAVRSSFVYRIEDGVETDGQYMVATLNALIGDVEA